eukprot:gene9153-10126_t
MSCKESFCRVLHIIKTNAASIVDDTSLEKVLAWISKVTANPNDEACRNLLVAANEDDGILNFLSPPCDTLFLCPLSANFALRLAGILGGASYEYCDLLDSNGTLDAIFISFAPKGSLLGHIWDNASVRNGFYQGLSDLLSSKSGYEWVKNKNFINLSTDSFEDNSFYVAQSAIKFTAKLLSVCKKSHDFPWHEIIIGRRNSDFVDCNVSMVDAFITLAINISEVDTKFAINLLVNLLSTKDSFSPSVPSYWNELIFQFVTGIVLSTCYEEHASSTSDWLKSVLENSKHYPMPSAIHGLLDELQSKFNKIQSSPKIWKQNLILVLDSNPLFLKEVRDSCSLDGKMNAQHWVDLLLDIIAITTKREVTEISRLPSPFVDVLLNRNSVLLKCIHSLKSLIHNGWYSDFSFHTKREVLESMLNILLHTSSNGRILSECLSVLSSIVELSDPEIIDIIVRSDPSDDAHCSENALLSVVKQLLHDERWEVQDSLIDFLITMIKQSERDAKLLMFLSENRCWLESYELLDAEESYIRASTVNLISFVISNEKLRDVFKNHVSLEQLLARLILILQSDDEAFPRRAVLDLVLHWLEISTVSRQFINVSNAIHDMTSSEIDEAQIMRMLVSSLGIAALDFDWEVKTKGIQCWHKIMNIINNDCSQNYSNETITNAIENNKLSKANAGRDMRENETIYAPACLKILCDHGGSLILVKAIYDCDQMVRESAYSALLYAKNSLSNVCNAIEQHSNGLEPASNTAVPDSKEEMFSICSYHDIEDKIDSFKAKLLHVEGFSEFLHEIDFECLGRSLQFADAQLVDYPVSLFNDILTASTASDDNLLDCY